MLFAFHGYGEAGSSFAFIGEALDPAHTLIAIDLPFHGRTEWKEGLSFTPEQLYAIMQHIAGRHSLTGPDPTCPAPGPDPTRPTPGPWGLIGYSMGGRIVLQLAENHPDSIDKLILLAPDGLSVNSWYWVATRTALGNLLFRWTMRRPGWLFLLLRISHTLRLVNPSIYKFAVHYIDDGTVRHDLYTRWTTMRKFRPAPSIVAEIIRRRQLAVSLVYGRYDRIIPWERGEKFRNRRIDHSRLILLDTGHQLLRSQFLPDLLPLISA